MKKKVLMAMSGGVDSSVSAALLLEAGYDLIGITMRLWDEECEKPEGSRTCCAIDDVNDAKSVASRLGIPHYTINLRDKFRDYVVGDFISEYSEGKTPNPCVICNRYLKFDALIDKAAQLECDYVATGHYARVLEEGGRYFLKKAADKKKDQSYFLYHLNKKNLPKVLMPLGGFSGKEETRKLAEKFGLRVASKPDSQDICFIPDGDYKSFLLRHAPHLEKKGDIVLSGANKVLGRHSGLAFHTVGQRRGLNIGWSEPLYVKELDVESNRLVVSPKDELFKSELLAEDLSFTGDTPQIGEEHRLMVKIRYKSPEVPAKVIYEGDSRLRVIFDEPQMAITPGQSAVCYMGECVWGGGVIK